MSSRPSKRVIRISVFDLVLLVVTALAIFGVSRAGTLSCTVRATTCSGGETEVLKMSGLTDAHAELPSQANYTQLVCCSGVTGLSNSCAGVATTALNLSGLTNAHVQQNAYGTYANSACLSVPSGSTISVGYQVSNCTGFDTTLASMSAATNAHIGDTTAYTTKICGSGAAGTIISVSVSDGIIAYGSVAFGASSSTVGSPEQQLVTNDGSTTEAFNIKGQNAPCPWTLAASAGNEQYRHEFSTTTTDWGNLTTNYQTLATGIVVSTSIALDLRVTVPTLTTCNTSQAVDVMVQAVQG